MFPAFSQNTLTNILKIISKFQTSKLFPPQIICMIQRILNILQFMQFSPTIFLSENRFKNFLWANKIMHKLKEETKFATHKCTNFESRNSTINLIRYIDLARIYILMEERIKNPLIICIYIFAVNLQKKCIIILLQYMPTLRTNRADYWIPWINEHRRTSRTYKTLHVRAQFMWKEMCAHIETNKIKFYTTLRLFNFVICKYIQFLYNIFARYWPWNIKEKMFSC